jgi:ABC-type multidrug transport system ATPase subunit
LFDGLSFSLPPSGVVGVIGPNGVGKTTLFKMIVGEERPDPGRWFWFEGNFAAYQRNKIDRPGAETARPHRMAHLGLTRD